MIVIIIFIVVVTGMSEAVTPVLNYYNNTYKDNHAYIALVIGMILEKLKGL